MVFVSIYLSVLLAFILVHTINMYKLGINNIRDLHLDYKNKID